MQMEFDIVLRPAVNLHLLYEYKNGSYSYSSKADSRACMDWVFTQQLCSKQNLSSSHISHTITKMRVSHMPTPQIVMVIKLSIVYVRHHWREVSGKPITYSAGQPIRDVGCKKLTDCLNCLSPPPECDSH